jgi:hypothetical protein
VTIICASHVHRLMNVCDRLLWIRGRSHRTHCLEMTWKWNWAAFHSRATRCGWVGNGK